MKIINKTKKYLHVRMTNEEFAILEEGMKVLARKKHVEKQRLEYAEWFFTNHIDVSWQDEYSSWHTDWINVETKKSVQAPDMYVKRYQYQFKNIMDKNKKQLGYKE